MKPFNELTYRGKVQRFRQLARVALDAYGLGVPHLKFLRMAGNTLFQVIESHPPTIKDVICTYVEGQYLLRIHDPAEQATEAIKLELEWLTAIRREAGLPVPEPVPTMDGQLLVPVSIPGVPGKRDCSLLRWIKGHFEIKRIQPHHFEAQGRIMAQLHSHAENWRPPQGLNKRRFDYEGLFKDDAGTGLPNSEAWLLLPRNYLTPCETVARRVEQIMGKWGKGPSVYGLIHGDCGVDANVLFWKGEARPIDFDGSGFGYYMYDLSIALEHCWDDKKYAQYREALLKGYAEYRFLTYGQLQQMDLFLAAFYVYMGLWTVAMDHVYPDSPNGPYRRHRWLERGMNYINRYLEQSNLHD